jgi:hypothetical protein
MKDYGKYLKNNRKIYPIKEDYIFPNIQFGDKKVVESLVFHPGEVWYDENGLVRMFSIKFEEGDVGNFFLFPKNSPMAFVYETLNTDIISFGLKLIGETVLHGSSVIQSVSQYLYKKASDSAERTISDFLEDMNTANLGYVELKSKEIVFNNLMTMDMGIPMQFIEMSFHNPNDIDLIFETSRNSREWKTFKVEANRFMKFYFMNAQKSGYFRIKTRQSDYKIYEIRAPNSYSINWNEQSSCWDLFLR